MLVKIGRFYRHLAALLVIALSFTTINCNCYAGVSSNEISSQLNTDIESEASKTANGDEDEISQNVILDEDDNLQEADSDEDEISQEAVASEEAVSQDAISEEEVSQNAVIEEQSISQNVVMDSFTDDYIQEGMFRIVPVDSDMVEEPIAGYKALYGGLYQSSNFLSASIYESPYDKYSTYYYYNRMNANEKLDYDALKKACDNYMLNTSGLAMINSNGKKYVLSGVKLKGVSEDASDSEVKQYAKALVYRFVASNPQYFFICHYYYSNYSTNTIYMAIPNECAVKSDFLKMRDDLFNSVDNAIAQIGGDIDADDEEAVLSRIVECQEWICNRTSYYYLATSDLNDFDEFMRQTIYSTFQEPQTICAGYARAMQLLCNYYDIDSLLVQSTNHAWVLVKYCDNWYNVDPTWADQTPISYQYFMRSSSWYLNEPSSDKRISHTPDEACADYLPKVNLGATDTNYKEIPKNIEVASSQVELKVGVTKRNENDCLIVIEPSLDDVEIFLSNDGKNADGTSARCKLLADGKYETSLDELDQIQIEGVKAGYLNSKPVKPVYAKGDYLGSACVVNDEINIISSYSIPNSILQNENHRPYAEYVNALGDRYKAELSADGKVAYPVDPSKMSIVVKAKIYGYVEAGDSYVELCSNEICFADYAKSLLNDTKVDDDTKEYIRLLLLFGGECQKYSNIKKDKLVSEGITSSFDISFDEFRNQLMDLEYQKTKGHFKQCKASLQSVSLSVDSHIDVNVVFSVDKNADFTVSIGDEALFSVTEEEGIKRCKASKVSFSMKGTNRDGTENIYQLKYPVFYSNMNAGKDDLANIKLSIGEVGEGTITTSVLAYIEYAVNSKQSEFINIRNMCKYMYLMSNLLESK